MQQGSGRSDVLATALKFTVSKETFRHILRVPGVYIFVDSNNTPIYVGKAKNLFNRLNSYLNIDLTLYPKTAQMLRQAKYVKIIPTLSEVEAFILEQNLIKTLQPKYNVKLKDDGSYPYVAIEKVNLENKTFYYRVYVTRNKRPNQNIKYLGPYVEANVVKTVLRALRRIFPFPDCSKTKFKRYSQLKRPCLYGQIGVCPAPCVNSGSMEQVKQNVRHLVTFLERGQSEIVRRLDRKMRKLIKEEKFEEAQKLRDTLITVNQLYNVNILKQGYLDSPVLIEELYTVRVKQIADFFKIELFEGNLENFRIDCFDMSHFYGEYMVGAMAVSVGGRLEKSKYRRFKIKTVEIASDVDMVKETIFRRLKHTDWGVPNIILIDGGRTQLKAAYRAFLEFSKKYPVIADKYTTTLWASIVKPNDDFYVLNKSTGRILFKKVKERNVGIQHLRELRDEAHRYARSYTRQKAVKGLVS